MGKQPESSVRAYPSIADLETPVPTEKFRDIVNEYSKAGVNSGATLKFNYAWALLRTKERENHDEAIRIFNQVSAEFENRRLECLYYLSLAHYRIEEYKRAQHYVDRFLDYSDDQAAKDLQKQINRKIEREGLIGIGIVAVTVSAVAGIVAALTMRPSRR